MKTIAQNLLIILINKIFAKNPNWAEYGQIVILAIAGAGGILNATQYLNIPNKYYGYAAGLIAFCQLFEKKQSQK